LFVDGKGEVHMHSICAHMLCVNPPLAKIVPLL
jgi:hypothetical protein